MSKCDECKGEIYYDQLNDEHVCAACSLIQEELPLESDRFKYFHAPGSIDPYLKEEYQLRCKIYLERFGVPQTGVDLRHFENACQPYRKAGYTIIFNDPWNRKTKKIEKTKYISHGKYEKIYIADFDLVKAGSERDRLELKPRTEFNTQPIELCKYPEQLIVFTPYMHYKKSALKTFSGGWIEIKDWSYCFSCPYICKNLDWISSDAIPGLKFVIDQRNKRHIDNCEHHYGEKLWRGSKWDKDGQCDWISGYLLRQVRILGSGGLMPIKEKYLPGATDHYIIGDTSWGHLYFSLEDFNKGGRMWYRHKTKQKFHKNIIKYAPTPEYTWHGITFAAKDYEKEFADNIKKSMTVDDLNFSDDRRFRMRPIGSDSFIVNKYTGQRWAREALYSEFYTGSRINRVYRGTNRILFWPECKRKAKVIKGERPPISLTEKICKGIYSIYIEDSKPLYDQKESGCYHGLTSSQGLV